MLFTVCLGRLWVNNNADLTHLRCNHEQRLQNKSPTKGYAQLAWLDFMARLTNESYK